MVNKKFSYIDRIIIKSYESTVKGISNLFGNACEVLVHSLEDYEKAVVYIENGHNSSRTIGAPITNLALELINGASKNKKFVEPYESKFPNGDRCKSVTIPIKNNERIIGLLCINFNMEISIFDFAKQFFINDNIQNSDDNLENYSANIEDMMKSILEKNVNSIILDMSIPNQDKNKEIILKLHEIGFFHLKGSVEYLAEKLQISEHTVYSNIRKYTKSH